VRRDEPTRCARPDSYSAAKKSPYSITSSARSSNDEGTLHESDHALGRKRSSHQTGRGAALEKRSQPCSGTERCEAVEECLREKATQHKRKIVWRSVRPCPAWSRPELFLNGPQWRTRRTLWPGKVAFSNYALVLFAGTLDSIFELAPTVRKLFGHLVGSARHVTTYEGPEVYDLTDLEFM
jgi:hypothetical protein